MRDLKSVWPWSRVKIKIQRWSAVVHRSITFVDVCLTHSHAHTMASIAVCRRVLDPCLAHTRALILTHNVPPFTTTTTQCGSCRAKLHVHAVRSPRLLSQRCAAARYVLVVLSLYLTIETFCISHNIVLAPVACGTVLQLTFLYPSHAPFILWPCVCCVTNICFNVK